MNFFKGLLESQDYTTQLSDILYNVIEIPFTRIGAPDIEMINGDKWKKEIDIDEVLNETLGSDEDIDGYRSTGITWKDALPDGVLFATPSDIEYVADFISEKALEEGLFIVDIYMYFFALLIKEAKYNKIPVEKMFTQVKKNLLKKLNSMNSKDFFNIISVLK